MIEFLLGNQEIISIIFGFLIGAGFGLAVCVEARIFVIKEVEHGRLREIIRIDESHGIKQKRLIIVRSFFKKHEKYEDYEYIQTPKLPTVSALLLENKFKTYSTEELIMIFSGGINDIPRLKRFIAIGVPFLYAMMMTVEHLLLKGYTSFGAFCGAHFSVIVFMILTLLEDKYLYPNMGPYRNMCIAILKGEIEEWCNSIRKEN